jgi:hypothetical protein
MMKVRYVCTVDDLLEGHLFAAERLGQLRDSIRRGRRINLYLFGAFSLALGLGMYSAHGLTVAVIGALCIAAMGVLFYVRFPARLRKTVEKNNRKMLEAKGEGIVGEHTVECAEEGLIMVSRQSQQVFAWSSIREVWLCERQVLVQVSPVAVIVIPRGGVQEGDLDAFVDAVSARVTTRHIDASEQRALAKAQSRKEWRRLVWPVCLGVVWTCVLYEPTRWLADWLLPVTAPNVAYYALHAILLAPVPLTLTVLRAQPEVRADQECRCRQCGYVLRGLREPRCPECGEAI